MRGAIDRSTRSAVVWWHGNHAGTKRPDAAADRLGVVAAGDPDPHDPLVGTSVRVPRALPNAGQTPSVLRGRGRSAAQGARRDHPRSQRSAGRRRRASFGHRGPAADGAARPVPRRLDASGPVAAARDPHRGHRTTRRRAHDPRRGPARDARDGQPLESGGVRHRARAPRHRSGASLARPPVGHGAAGVPPLPPDPGLRAQGPAHDRPGVLRRRARPSRLVGAHAGSPHAGLLVGRRGARRRGAWRGGDQSAQRDPPRGRGGDPRRRQAPRRGGVLRGRRVRSGNGPQGRARHLPGRRRDRGRGDHGTPPHDARSHELGR